MTYAFCNIYDYDDGQYRAMYDAMSPERRARADGFRFKDDRMRCICADMLCRKMLAKASGLDAKSILFAQGEKGKPYANVPCHFNVSHSADFVLCAVSEGPIGVDIEQIKPFRAGLVARYFSDTEAAYVWSGKAEQTGNVTDPDTCARFYRVWTAKEAYVKMTGTGISTDLSAVTFDPDACTVCSIPLLMIDAPDGYVASIIKSDSL